MTDTFHITLPKKFTYGDYSWFFEKARVGIEKADTLELNCHKVSYLDPAALGVIAYLHKQLKVQRKNELIVTAPSSYCDEVFRISNMYAHYVKRKPETAT